MLDYHLFYILACIILEHLNEIFTYFLSFRSIFTLFKVSTGKPRFKDRVHIMFFLFFFMGYCTRS